MGLMRFLVPAPSQFPPDAHERTYVTGLDMIPWRCEVRRQGDEIQVVRFVADSGNVHVPWYVPGRGELMLHTCTLIERMEPYLLAVELARGKVNQLRNQAADWQAIGLAVSDEVWEDTREATRLFAKAAAGQQSPSLAINDAQRALAIALRGADALVECYVEQALMVRHRQGAQLPTVLAAVLPAVPASRPAGEAFVEAFNAAAVPFAWRDIEAQESKYEWEKYDQLVAWCAARNRPVIGGPLVRLDANVLPDWLCLWEGDFENVVSVVRDFIETVINRYRGKVAAWQCAARVNTGRALGLSEEERLRLAVGAIEAVRQADPDTPVILRFDQPWAEFMTRTDTDLSPLHFADAIVRSGLGLSAVGLDLDLGYLPSGSTLRERLDLGRLIDLWSCLGLPLFVGLTLPSSAGKDPTAWGAGKPDDRAVDGGWTPAAQARGTESVLHLLLSKPAVQAVVWNQWSDAGPHEFPHGGLLDASGEPKPLLSMLAGLRKAHLR